MIYDASLARVANERVSERASTPMTLFISALLYVTHITERHQLESYVRRLRPDVSAATAAAGSVIVVIVMMRVDVKRAGLT